MPRHSQPRSGSMQFWPRKRARKFLPSVNWEAIPKEDKGREGFLGFIVYKIAMASCSVKDNTQHSLTKGKKIIIPATILEAPPLKILSIRFYKNGKIVKEVFVGSDKELKRKIRLSKKQEKKDKADLRIEKDYDKICVVVYSLVSRTNIKKTPDIAEIGISGAKEKQLEFVKNFIHKDIMISDIFSGGLVDARGLTKGKGLQGPVKRFGVSLRQHKSEKGVRKVGSIGPWHPAHVSYRVAMAGQTGFFTRVCYNNKIISIGKISEKNINPQEGFRHYGKIKTDYIIVKGSVPGPAKRQLLLTEALRPSKKQSKKNYEFIEIVK